jgi:hypothetical protein
LSRVTDLPVIIEALPAGARERVQRLFGIELVEGRTDPPPEMHDWLRRQFGSVEAVRHQTIVRIVNRWTLEGALISPLRGLRPIEAHGLESMAAEVERTRGGPFCDPEHDTPADPWGRVRGPHTVTGANAAMYDGLHDVIILDHHDPLAFDQERVVELLAVGREWAERAERVDPAARNYLLIWNCGWRAGGSVVHGHAQVLLGRGDHYPQLERRRRDAIAYAAEIGAPYYQDLVAAHRDLGLVIVEADGVAVLASLTPVKERELLIIGPPGMDERDPAFSAQVARSVVAYRDVAGVRSFNLALHRPPLGTPADDALWAGIGPVVHLVDRGDPGSRASDIGAMELYATSVVGGDPFDLAERLRDAVASG